jgi:hypothetical protein
MNILTKIENSFKEMVKIGKVDFRVVNSLKKFKEDLLKSKKKISFNKPLIESFSIFHAIETQIRIVDQMIIRLNKSQQIHDNPTVAEDALVILPPFKELYDTLIGDMTHDPHYIMGLSSRLQISAMRNNMYPSPEQITKLADKRTLKENFIKFVSGVGEEIERI